MAFDYKSLLGKQTPGKSWGELAAGYFSGNSKNSNRSRNALIAMLGFNAWESKRQSSVFKNLKELEDNQTVQVAKAQAEYNKRAKILESQESIKTNGAYKHFESEAESWFNNAENQAAGFDPLDFEDTNSPMYNVKRQAMQRYTDEFLMPRHDAKYVNIDKNIDTFEEYSKPVKDLFKAKAALASSPGKTSLVHKGLNFIGIGGDQKYIDKVATTKAVVDKYNKRRNNGNDLGSIFASDFDENFKMKNLYDLTAATPKGTTYEKGTAVGMLPSEIEAGLQYSEGQFRRSDMFKQLKTAGARKEAIAMFNTSETRNEEDVLEIIQSSVVMDSINARKSVFNAYKNNDEDFNKIRPLPTGSKDDVSYKEKLEVWTKQRDDAYSRGGAKYAAAREASGYKDNAIVKYESEIAQLMEYQLDVMQQKELLVAKEIDQATFNKFITDKRNTLLNNWTSEQLNKDNSLKDILDGAFEKSISQVDTFFASTVGQEEVRTRRDSNDAKTNTQSSLEEIETIMRKEKIQDLTRSYTTNLKWFNITQPEISLNFGNELDDAIN
tara:strand:- start:851 stop:2506 length:1656 start_codon:yes stop_codon:yes gene_type:complete